MLTIGRVAIVAVLASRVGFLAQAQDGSGPYENAEQGFSITPDPAWNRTESSKGGFSALFWPASSGRAVQVSVRVRPATADAKTIRDLVVKSIAGQSQYAEVALEEHTVAELKAPSFSVDMISAGRTYRVRQAFLVVKGLQYTLECHAPKEEFAAREPLFKKVWASFCLVPIARDSKNALRALAARCGSELEWASTWVEAAARARRERKLVLVTVKLLGPYNVTGSVRSTLFMDPDVVPLVQRRFVPLAFRKGMAAPFVPQESSYGMSPMAFGTSVLLVTPDGKVVGDTAVLKCTAFDAFLRETLAKQPALDGKPTPGGREGLDLAAWHLERGELRAALALSAADPSVRGRRIEAAVLRRRRQGAPAAAKLAAAYAAGDLAERADIMLDSSWVYARMGGFRNAEEVLVTLVSGLPAHTRIPEAKWLLGVCRFRTGGKSAATRVWKELVRAHPESRWAWRAAGSLTSTAYQQGSDDRFRWPSEEVLEAAGRSETEALPTKKARRAEAAAIAYLLRVQRKDGSWVSPDEAAFTPTASPRPTTVAKTAICAQSLIHARGRPEVRAAIDRALTWLRGARESWKTSPPKAYYMDYRPWSMAFELWLYADALRANVGDVDELRLVSSELVGQLREQQRGGGWSYAVTFDLGRKGLGKTRPISFMTAAITGALHEARDAGIPVPQTLLKKAYDCLELMRGPKQTFAYFRWQGQAGAQDTPAPGAAGRGPACMLALMGGGRAEREDLITALDLFLEWRHTYAKEQGKTLMHCGADGQGSHYLLFDYMFAARGVERLPASKRGKYRKAVLELILGARSKDGSFVDNPVNGSHYGTGMALIGLQRLRR